MESDSDRKREREKGFENERVKENFPFRIFVSCQKFGKLSPNHDFDFQRFKFYSFVTANLFCIDSKIQICEKWSINEKSYRRSRNRTRDLVSDKQPRLPQDQAGSNHED